MFGYIAINKQTLTEEEQSRYQGYYCGVCRALRQQFGLPARLTLSYDFAFMALLLTALYEDEDQHMRDEFRCVVHPFKKMPSVSNEYVQYAADMTVLLTYHKCQDDWLDEKKLLSKTEAKLLEKHVKELEPQYPRQNEVINNYIKTQQEAEQRNETDLDTIANISGVMLAELFAYRNDAWLPVLRSLGFHLGKFIYLMDAYEDIDKDIKKNNYNPLKQFRNESDFEQRMAEILTDTIADCAAVFERMPIVLNADLLRNILYSGVWSRYIVIHNGRMQKEQQTPKDADFTTIDIESS